MGRKRVSGNATPAKAIFDQKEAEKFRARFPNIEICGKNQELYRCGDALLYLKETSQQTFADIKEFERKLIKNLNSQH